MQNTMRAHSAGQIAIEGGVDVNKGHMVYSGVSYFYRPTPISNILVSEFQTNSLWAEGVCCAPP